MSRTIEDENSALYKITRKNLCEVIFRSKLKSLDGKFEDLFAFLVKVTNCPDDSQTELKQSMQNFRQQFLQKWTKSNRTKARFLASEATWLRKECSFKLYRISHGGRPAKEFSECSEQSKRRKTVELRESFSAEELTYAAQMKFRSDNKLSEAKHVKQALSLSDSSVDKSFEHKGQEKLTPQQALSLLIEAQLSKNQYNIIRNYAKNVFPSYKIVKKEKMSCYPEGDKYTEVKAEVPVQSLLNHTATRLLHVQEDVLMQLNQANKLKLDIKWGFDGSSSHTQYMQKFSSGESDDKYIFLTSLVPVRLTMEENGKIIVIWHNPRPSSPRFCRPILLQYQKETTELTKENKAHIESQIRELVDTKVLLKDKEFSVSYNLIFTMIDGKICNALSETKSTMRCYLCGATSSEFNNLNEVIKKPVEKKYLSFGISVLHSWIRLFECLLHVFYKLPVKSWRTNVDNKAIVSENKSKIQQEFKEKLSLIVDKPKPGLGNTNDSNVARKFFQNHEISAEITGLDAKLIYRFYIILQVISSKFEIDTEKFQAYCWETAQLYVSLYPWCPMTTTVHKILIHGKDIISEFLLPIGCLSEEAQEARNKDFKIYRERFSRKCSRAANMVDVFNRLLVSSDPVITAERSLPILDRKAFDPEALDMLIDPFSKTIS